jgi:glycosyltransferase involved in cell wall biosynthesis
MSEQPLVSIVCPVYNAERYLDQTVRSVLGQSYPNWELLLMIDAKSSDGSLSMARAWTDKDSRIRTHEAPTHLGVANNRNHGIQIARGEFLAFLDADDLWLPMKLERQVHFMLTNKVDFSCHSYSQIDPEGRPLQVTRVCPPVITFQDLLRSNVIGCLTVMIKTKLLKQFSFATDQPHEDFILWLEILKRTSKAYGLAENLALYRVLPQSRSGDKKRAARERWHIYRNVLQLSLASSLYYFFWYAFMAIKQRQRSTSSP